ncbi:hypothetical protein TSAR_015703 [Trichomalopsis sarcophagae]|uniref:C2H2-type domain-containing protein n=1 Tax=Trichomalopsis sarcophagae TaxID=543379 RepID=A0A232F4N4_9HYME|nr:hypothetical protein TSAR_015703 [Trichomalopsis sarcophagae]
MYTTLVRNYICRTTNGFLCTVCHVEVKDTDDASKHVTTDDKHLAIIDCNGALPKNSRIDEQKYIELLNNGIIPVSSREYKCTFCSSTIPNLGHISEHINGKKHIKARRKIVGDDALNDQYPSIQEPLLNVPTNDQDRNREETSSGISCTLNSFSTDETSSGKSCILNSSSNGQDKSGEDTCSSKSYTSSNSPVHCISCKSNLESDSTLLYHKMFHLSQRSGNITDIIKFTIKDNMKKIYCLICDHIMMNEDDLERHLNGLGHQKRLVVVHCPNNNTIMSMMYLNYALYTNIPMNNIYNTLNAEFNRYLYYAGCNLHHNRVPAVQNSYANQHENSTNTMPQLQQHMHQNINSIYTEYFCFICTIKCKDENLLFMHYNYDYVHKYRMTAIHLVLKDENMQFVTYANNEVIKCLKCQIQLTELNGAVTHLFEIQHISKPANDENAQFNDSVNNANVSRTMYVCPVCKINSTYDYMMVQHLESDYHKNEMQKYYSNMNGPSFEKVIFFCPFCKTNFFNDKILLEHFYRTHEYGLKNAIQTNNIIFTNSSGKGDVNYALNNLVNLDLDKKYCSMIKQRTPFQQQENDDATLKIRTKNLINFSPRYVKLCVERGDENIFQINPERIKRLQLDISLTFPHESNRGCIPCGWEISSDPQQLYEHLRTEEHEKNVQEMEENDEFFDNYRDQFSDLELAKSYMHEDSDEWVKCIACDIKIENCNLNLRTHINSEPHISNYQSYKKSADEIFQLFRNIFENLWYYIEKYFCNICSAQFEFEVDYARHLEKPSHLKEVEKRILRKQKLQFDCCILCSSYWFANSDHHSIHCDRDSHKYILKSRDFNVPEMNIFATKLLTSVEKTIDNLIIESNETILSSGDSETKLLESVEAVVKSKYPLAKAYLFGSRISSLGFKDSDLDIFLDCENQYVKPKSMVESQEQLLTVQDCFHKYQDIWVIMEVIVRTRVPIIKLKHRSTNLNCDISFINGLGVEKSKILGYYVDACTPCRKLILYLKKWNLLCRLSGRRGITTYAISWLVIFYLQIKEILPSVQSLIKLQNRSNIVAGWETGVSKEISVKNIDFSISDLLKGFFTYYADFNYISDVACPFLGKVMKKSQFSNIDDLPEEMSIYKSQIKKENVEFFRLDSPMCIQDPIDLSQNITKAVTKLQLRMFKQYCAESAKGLQN